MVGVKFSVIVGEMVLVLVAVPVGVFVVMAD